MMGSALPSASDIVNVGAPPNAVASGVKVTRATDGGDTDVTSALNTFFAQGKTAYRLGLTVDAATNDGKFVVNGPVNVGYRTSYVTGDGYGTRIYTGASPNAILFQFNTNGSDWVTPLPTVNTTKISDFYLNADAAATNGVYVTAIQIGGPSVLHDAQFSGCQTAISQVNQYLDMTRVERVSFYNQPTTNGWAIDLKYTGDGVFLNQNHFQFKQTGSDLSTRTRVRAVRLRFKVGAIVQNHLNGDHLFDQCDSILCQSMHMEDGLIEFRNSTGKLASSSFWMRGPGVGECSITPVQLTYNSGLSTVIPGAVKLSDLQFIYEQDFPGSHSTTNPNFSLQQNPSTYMGAVEVENLIRAIRPNTGSPGMGQLFGVSCGMSDFDNYSHMASMKSRYSQGRWEISDSLPGFAATATVGIDVATSATDTEHTFNAASGTYYYKMTVLLDKMRLVGIAGSAEKAFTLTSGGDAPVLIIDAATRFRAIYRIYRGTTSGSYDSYVDVPLIAGVRLCDTGTDIAGYPWISRTAGAVDTINSNSILGFELQPGEISAASDAYGHAVVRTRGNQTTPTSGSWRRGDIVLLETPVNDNFNVMIGYVRRTDCTLAAPAHVLNTDWFELWVPYRPAIASLAELQSATNTVNTTNKKLGKMVFCSNTTPPKPVWAAGATATASWVDATGTAVANPA